MSHLAIHSFSEASIESEFMSSVLSRLARFEDNHIDLFTSPRLDSGWIEWIAHIRKDKDAKMSFVLGCIQRKVGAGVEFHS